MDERTFVDNVRVGGILPALAIVAGLAFVAAIIWLVCRK